MKGIVCAEYHSINFRHFPHLVAPGPDMIHCIVYNENEKRIELTKHRTNERKNETSQNKKKNKINEIVYTRIPTRYQYNCTNPFNACKHILKFFRIKLKIH